MSTNSSERTKGSDLLHAHFVSGHLGIAERGSVDKDLVGQQRAEVIVLMANDVDDTGQIANGQVIDYLSILEEVTGVFVLGITLPQLDRWHRKKCCSGRRRILLRFAWPTAHSVQSIC